MLNLIIEKVIVPGKKEVVEDIAFCFIKVK